MTIGGMPAVVNTLVTNGNFSGTLKMQRQLLLDYEEDITKYVYNFHILDTVYLVTKNMEQGVKENK